MSVCAGFGKCFVVEYDEFDDGIYKFYYCENDKKSKEFENKEEIF